MEVAPYGLFFGYSTSLVVIYGWLNTAITIQFSWCNNIANVNIQGIQLNTVQPPLHNIVLAKVRFQVLDGDDQLSQIPTWKTTCNFMDIFKTVNNTNLLSAVL